MSKNIPLLLRNGKYNFPKIVPKSKSLFYHNIIRHRDGTPHALHHCRVFVVTEYYIWNLECSVEQWFGVEDAILWKVLPTDSENIHSPFANIKMNIHKYPQNNKILYIIPNFKTLHYKLLHFIIIWCNSTDRKIYTSLQRTNLPCEVHILDNITVTMLVLWYTITKQARVLGAARLSWTLCIPVCSTLCVKRAHSIYLHRLVKLTQITLVPECKWYN